MLSFVATAAATLRWHGRAAGYVYHIMIMIVEKSTAAGAMFVYSLDCGTYFHNFYIINAYITACLASSIANCLLTSGSHYSGVGRVLFTK